MKTKSTKHGPPNLARIRSGPLVTRFTKQQQELAEKISNDISEDIDCGENRQLLRMAVAFWADVASEQYDKNQQLRTNHLLEKMKEFEKQMRR